MRPSSGDAEDADGEFPIPRRDAEGTLEGDGRARRDSVAAIGDARAKKETLQGHVRASRGESPASLGGSAASLRDSPPFQRESLASQIGFGSFLRTAQASLPRPPAASRLALASQKGLAASLRDTRPPGEARRAASGPSLASRL